MHVCVVGMHRSGTSLMAKLLHTCGVYLGADGDLVPATADNPDGHWEHEQFLQVNDAILSHLGGGWDDPPAPVRDWDAPAFAPYREAARRVVEPFLGHATWGWKDPRTSLTLPLWQSVVPAGLKVVVCVRNPLEVALSLRRRGLCSLALGLHLWQVYYERILAAIRHTSRIVTHYGAHFDDSAGELKRILNDLDIDPTPDRLAACRAATNADLRHNRFQAAHLREFGASHAIRTMYAQLCAEAGYDDEGDPLPPPVDFAFGTMIERIGRADDVRAVRLQLRRTNSREAREQRRALAAEVRELREELALQFRDPETASPQKLAYRQLVRRVRQMVRAHVPRGVTFVVVSKGDDDLVRFVNRRGWHFPQEERGGYAGHYPACGLAAIAHLEVLRSRGAEFFLLPETAAWWLDRYPDFQAHLASRYRAAVKQDGTGVLYSLAIDAKTPASDALADLLSRFRTTFGRPPTVLDWNTRGRLAAAHSDLTLFPPPSKSGLLPYFDRSIDIVAVATADEDFLAEAKRVAEVAVVVLIEGDAPAVHWLQEFPTCDLPSASIIVPVFNNWRLTSECLQALRETIPAVARVEIVVVDDASRDDTAEMLASLTREDPRIRVLKMPSNVGFVEACNRGAAAATGDVLIFLNNDTIPLPGWLPALLRTFAVFPEAGAVGGKLLFPDGRLQEAGGVIFDDGSAAHYGRNEPDPSKSLFNFAREVDYCSGALLATPRTLFESLGAFGDDFKPGYYEDVDYCFRVRAAGKRVYYQPESAVVHLEGGTAGSNFAAGMKQYQLVNHGRFRERWDCELAKQPPRPKQFDEEAWYRLARRGAAE